MHQCSIRYASIHRGIVTTIQRDFEGMNIYSQQLFNYQINYYTFTFTLPSACNSEQAAAVVLGFTQVSWDDLSGQEPQPWSMRKSWVELSGNEKSAAVLLGYTQTTWDNDSDLEPQPASAVKNWTDLTACG